MIQIRPYARLKFYQPRIYLTNNSKVPRLIDSKEPDVSAESTGVFDFSVEETRKIVARQTLKKL